MELVESTPKQKAEAEFRNDIETIISQLKEEKINRYEFLGLLGIHGTGFAQEFNHE